MRIRVIKRVCCNCEEYPFCEHAPNAKVIVERRNSYQGVPQYGISGQSEITPSREIAEKWAMLENARRRKTND